MSSKQSLLSKRSGMAFVLAAGGLWAQAGDAPNFEVASIRPNNLGGATLVQALPGRLVMTNFSVRTLIVVAYGVQGYQITGDPSWIASADYDLQATAAGNTSVNQMEGPMLRALLEDRFKLAVHRETRQLPAYELTLVKDGMKLRQTKEGSCTPYAADAPPPSQAAAGAGVPFCGYPHSAVSGLSASGLNHALDGAGVSMEVLATNLSRLELHRSVLDRTGLTGAYDIHLQWTSDPPSGPAENPTGPTLFTALQEQLGLKLAPTRGPVEVLVIDHIEKPSGN